MSNDVAHLDEIIQIISTNTGLGEAEIAMSVGRNSGYISQLRSRQLLQ